MACNVSKDPSSTDFTILKFDLSETKDSLSFVKWQDENLLKVLEIQVDTLFTIDSIPIGHLVYSDRDYKVYANCFGEFGGSLMFQDRKNKDSIYYLESVCPLQIERRNCTYFIVSSLPHVDGFSKIILLDSPKNLILVPKDSLAKNWKGIMFPDPNPQVMYSATANQGKVLLDTNGILVNLLFDYDGKNYLVYSDYPYTLLGRLNYQSIEVLDTLLDFSIRRDIEVLNDQINGFKHFHIDYKNTSIIRNIKEEKIGKGDIYIQDDKIVLGFNNEKRSTPVEPKNSWRKK